MSETVDVPKVGPVKKPVVIAIAAGGAAFVGWRYYQSRQAAAADATAASTDGSFTDPGSIPAVDGAYTGQSVGLPDSSQPPSSSDYGFTGTTNSQWTQYAASQLSMSGTYDYSTVLADLGAYLAGKPLTTAQITIVQAAIAVAGNPPEGSHPLIPGGDTPITVAPTGLTATAINSTSVQLRWSAVPGAASYRIWQDGVSQVVGDSFTAGGQVGNLKPGTRYTFHVSAETASGHDGPKSAGVSVTTPAQKVSAPTGLKLWDAQRTSFNAYWSAVPGADGYDVYVNGQKHAVVDGNQSAMGGFKPGTRYSVYVVAWTHGGYHSPHSATATITTKK